MHVLVFVCSFFSFSICLNVFCSFLVVQICFSLVSAPVFYSWLHAFHFKIVVEFSLVASPIDVAVLAVVMAPMVSTIGISVTAQAHFQPEQLTLPLDRIRFSFQSQTHLLSAKKKGKFGKMKIESIKLSKQTSRHFEQQNTEYQLDSLLSDEWLLDCICMWPEI